MRAQGCVQPEKGAREGQTLPPRPAGAEARRRPGVPGGQDPAETTRVVLAGLAASIDLAR